MTFSMSPSSLHIAREKISGALDMPNGSLLQPNQPKGVTKVVCFLDSLSKCICQNTLLASSYKKVLLAPNSPMLSLTAGIGEISLLTALFRPLRSTQIRTSPDGLRTGTMPLHHSGSFCYGEITPFCNILSSFFLVLSRNGIVIFLGV